MDDGNESVTEKLIQSWKEPSAQSRTVSSDQSYEEEEEEEDYEYKFSDMWMRRLPGEGVTTETESVTSDQGYENDEHEYEYIKFPDIWMRRLPEGRATPDQALVGSDKQRDIGRKPLIIFSVTMLISLLMLTAALVMSCLRCFPECPNNWKKFHEKCYQFYKERATWHVARHKCQRLGADLVVIDNGQEEEFLTTNVRAPSDELWIGLHYKEAKQEWMWVDGTTNQSYISWNSKKLKLNDGQYDLHCAIVKKHANSKWWSNINCKGRCQFACERNKYVVCVLQSPFLPH